MCQNPRITNLCLLIYIKKMWVFGAENCVSACKARPVFSVYICEWVYRYLNILDSVV